MRISDGVTARQIESARSWLSSYLDQCEADLRRSFGIAQGSQHRN
jgi:hypothetical protein